MQGFSLSFLHNLANTIPGFSGELPSTSLLRILGQDNYIGLYSSMTMIVSRAMLQEEGTEGGSDVLIILLE